MSGTQKARERAVARAQHTASGGTIEGKTVTQLLEDLKPQIARALPKQMDADRFARIVMTTLRRQPELMQCDPKSLMAAVMLSSQLGLEPGPLGHAYLVPYKREVTFILGYKGIIDLARRSGEIETIEAREVREHDEFEFEFGLDPKLRHVPAQGDRGKPTHYWGLARFKDGGHYFEVLTRDDVEAFRERSATGKGTNPKGPWQTDFSAMARKTVVRRMAPFLPLNVEAARAVESDEGVVSDLPLDSAEVEVAHAEPIDVEADQGADGEDQAAADEAAAEASEAAEAQSMHPDGEAAEEQPW